MVAKTIGLLLVATLAWWLASLRVVSFSRAGPTAAVLLAVISLTQLPARAQEALAPRLQIGINLLPAVIAANNGIADLAADKSVKLYIVYLADDHVGELLKRSISRVGMVKKRPLKIISLSLDELLQQDIDPMSTLFIAEPMDTRIDDLIEYSKTHRALLFSPFEDDVARGVATGFHVTDRVRPWVNTKSLQQSKIQLKAFFLRIAVKHE